VSNGVNITSWITGIRTNAGRDLLSMNTGLAQILIGEFLIVFHRLALCTIYYIFLTDAIPFAISKARARL
jgi:hypothetical protein